MMKRLWLSLGVTLLVFVMIIIALFAKDYWISKENSYVIGTIDLYNASREELIAIDALNYTETFAKVETAKEAAEIAEKVIEEVYENDESPYFVKLNPKANAWIVHGSLPLFHLGGVGIIAIDKETGEILMLMHTK